MKYLQKIIQVFGEFPDRIALRIREESWSYGWLNARVYECQQFLKLAYSDSKSVAIQCEDSPHTYAFIIACLMSGKAFVPIHPAHPEDRNQRILRFAELAQPIAAASIPTTSTFNATPGLPLIDPSVIEQSIAYILFTSGSTGNPKGVPITQQALQTFIDACDATGLDSLSGKSCLQSFDLTFDLSLFGYLYPLVHGATVCTLPDDEIKQLAAMRILEDESVHTALMVPSMIRLLQPYFDRIELPDLKQVLFCGEALPLELMLQFKKCVPNALIRNVYGPTEATIFCMEYILPEDSQQWVSFQGVLSIGKPMKGTAIQLDSEGQLLLSGNQLSKGYLHADEKQQLAFQKINGTTWYQTGDLAKIDDSGNYCFVGRMDQQVKVQGYRIELGEIEFQVNQLIAPALAIAVMGKDTQNNPEINIFINNPELNIQEIKEILKTVLPNYMIPAQWHTITEFPLNVNGKIDRKALAAELYV